MVIRIRESQVVALKDAKIEDFVFDAYRSLEPSFAEAPHAPPDLDWLNGLRRLTRNALHLGINTHDDAMCYLDLAITFGWWAEPPSNDSPTGVLLRRVDLTPHERLSLIRKQNFEVELA